MNEKDQSALFGSFVSQIFVCGTLFPGIQAARLRFRSRRVAHCQIRKATFKKENVDQIDRLILLFLKNMDLNPVGEKILSQFQVIVRFY
jgi:hypothetical protein